MERAHQRSDTSCFTPFISKHTSGETPMERDTFDKLFRMSVTDLEVERKAVTKRIRNKWNAADSRYLGDIDTYTEALVGLRAKWGAEARELQRKKERSHLRLVS